MKKHLFLKTLLVLTGILIGSVSTPMWADITIYVTGSIFVGEEPWDNSTSTIKVDVRYQGSEGAFNDGDTYKDQTMINTGYTYNGYPIYSYTWTPSYGGGQYRFKHYKSGDWQEDYTAAWSTEDGKIYDGYYSSAHQWLTFGRDITIYAVPESMDGSKWDEGYTLKSIFKYGDGDSEKTDKITWERTEYTYDGNYIYTGSALMPYNVIKKIWFYYNDGSGDADLYECKPNGSDTQYGTNDIDGKIFLGWKDDCHKWVLYGRDVTVYTIPDYLFANYGTPYDEDTHYAAVCIQCETGSTWKTTNMEKTAYTYATYPIYTATFVLNNNKFWEYQIKYFKKSDDTQVDYYTFNNVEPKTEYGPSQIEDKIYRGWITSAHVFTPYAYDLELDQQVGSGGSSSVIVAEGSAMPAATMPSASGYTFGGYFTAVAGGGTKYYNANGSSAANWASRTITTLFAKFTQNITLNQNSATTSGTTSLAATYNAVLNASGITNPEKDYYDFGGWTNGSGGSGDVVINASKAVQTVASWTDGSKKWIHAGSSTLYAKWTEHPYTVTATASEGGSVGSASYTGKVVTTCAISATPNTGYKFSHWSVESGSATFADQYSASTTMNATSDAEIKANFVYRWSIAGTWKYYPDTDTEDADAYTMGNIGRNASSKDTCYVEITLAANTNYTFQVVDRSTSPYTWHKNSDDESAPFYMTYGNSTAWTFSSSYTKACGITTAGAGTYKFAYNISDGQVTVTYPNSYTVTFGYGTGGSAVTASVEDAGSINSGDYATAGKDITFTKTATNLAYTFKGWYNASSDGDAISCMASDDVYDDIAANISVYAQFKTRYGLHGSLMDDNAGGMPGWEGDGDDFVVRDYTDIGEGDGKGVELKCWRVLEPNREYKFRVQDRAAGSRWGLSESAVLPAEGVGSNIKLSTYGDENGKDVFLYTVGEGEYVFHITNMYDNRDGKYYPAIQVDRPASSQLTMGVYDSDHGSLSASSYKNNTFAITDGQFYANGSTLTFHATPNTGYHVEGWYSDASCETPYVSGTDGATICDPGDVSLVLSSVSTNKTVYVKFAEDENTLSTSGNWNTAGNWSAGHIPTINEVVYLPKAVTVDIAGAKAKRVRIQRDGESYTGKLTISATGGLVVAEDIKAQHEADGAYEATTKEDLRIETSYEGNGGLITGNACEGNNAEYEFYTKAYKYSYDIYKFYINQYIGIPFVSMEAYKLYGFNIFVYDDGADDWRTPGSATMEAWKAYDLIRRYENDDWSYFNLDGELNLPGKSATKTFTCSWRGTDGSIDKTAGHEDYLFANSWTAPISIKDITASNCSGTSGTDLVQTIYIFNAGYEGAGQKSVGEYAGQWSSFPLASSSYMANAVIPATQAFMVTSKKGSTGATLTLSYNDHVYKPAIDANQINTYPTRAPRRTQANDDPNVLRIIVRSSDVDADHLYVFERGDFTFDFDDSWDGNKILGESFAPQLYALSGSNKMAVNAVPDMEGMKIGFKAGKYDNQYTFSFEYADDAETLYLYDTDTQEYTQISSEATYSFTTSDTKEHERFVITRSKAPQIVTGVDGVVSASDARKQMINGTLYIIRDGRMYNAEGALVK